MTGLTRLAAHKNRLVELPTTIGNLTTLKQLTMNDNNLTCLPKEIGHLIELENLRLDGNKLDTLPETITQLTSLKGLNITKNNFSSFPDGMEKWIEGLESTGSRIRMNKQHRRLLLGNRKKRSGQIGRCFCSLMVLAHEDCRSLESELCFNHKALSPVW